MKHTKSQSCIAAGVTLNSLATDYVGDGEINEDIPVPHNTVNKHVLLNLVAAQVQSLFLLASKQLTLKTNSTSAPDETFILKANKAYSWDTDSYDTTKFPTTITDLYVSNAGTTVDDDTVLKIRAVSDVTP